MTPWVAGAIIQQLPLILPMQMDFIYRTNSITGKSVTTQAGGRRSTIYWSRSSWCSTRVRPVRTGTQQTTFDAMNLFPGLLTDPFIGGRGDPVSCHPSPPEQQPIGEPERQAVLADPLSGRLDVVGHAAIGDFAGIGIEHRERGRRIAVARLPHRAEHGQPAPPRQQLHADA